MQKEYWVNVYLYNIHGYIYGSKKEAIDSLDEAFIQPIYRIHVKMDGGYNKKVKPKYEVVMHIADLYNN